MTRSGNGLLCYTTSIEVDKTVGEIESLLMKAGATGILKECDTSGITSLSFKIKVEDNRDMAFRLPMEAQPVQQILNNQVNDGKIARKFKNDLDQARRVGWRIIKTWVEAQVALIQTRMVKVQQVFLPYAVGRNGKTLYEQFEETRYAGLLGEGKGDE